MATAVSTYASSISSTSLLRLHAPTYKRNCRASVAQVKCNATQERAKNAKSGSVSASRRSLLTVGVALPLSAILAGKAWAFVDEEEITGKQMWHKMSCRSTGQCHHVVASFDEL
jgi:hypothetical protein